MTPDGGGGWYETTYAELSAQVDALAHVLVSEMGLVSGNRVLLRGFNGRWMAAAWLATLKAGMVAVFMPPMTDRTLAADAGESPMSMAWGVMCTMTTKLPNARQKKMMNICQK